MGKIFGIDLGTTYSCIAYVDEYGRPVVVPNEENSPVTPSVVFFESGGNVSVGQVAKEALNSDPDLVCSTVKRQMGNRDFTFSANGQEYSPETVSSLILKKLAKDASDKLGEAVTDVVITCPAYFGLDEREATKKAGEIAGLNVLSIINEPTAAAISYGINIDKPQTVMVYDLGGGTFDITIIKVSAGVIEVIATDGDHNLGGKDWDEAIRQHAIQKYAENTGKNVDEVYDDPEIMGDLELRVETAKKQLSQRDTTTVKVEGEKIEISKELFDKLTSSLLQNTIEKIRETMNSAAKKGVTAYDKILLVGGSTRMPQVKVRLEQEFPDTSIEFCDPDEAVAKGASIYGINAAAFPLDGTGERVQPTDLVDKNNPIFQMGGNKSGGPILVKNVISQSIAVRLTTGIANQIFKNTAIPCSHILNAGTEVANQADVAIEIFENPSEEEYVAEDSCKGLVKDTLGPLPEGLPANAPIDVAFNIDEQGLLSVDATDVTSGRTVHLEVKLQNVMSQEEVEKAKQQVGGLRVL